MDIIWKFFESFSLNVGKYGPEKFRIQTLFTQFKCKKLKYTNEGGYVKKPYKNSLSKNMIITTNVIKLNGLNGWCNVLKDDTESLQIQDASFNSYLFL